MTVKMAASSYPLCVCCGTAKSKYYSFSSKNCALFQIENTIKFLVSSDINLTRIKSKNICDNCVKTVSQISTIRKNIIKACKTQTSDTVTTISTTTTPVDRGKRSAKTPPSQLRSGQTKKRSSVVDQLMK